MIKFYCDTSSIINMFKNGTLTNLKEYKEQIGIAEIQFKKELLFPEGIKELTSNSITLCKVTNEVFAKTNELKPLHPALSIYDALALAYCSINSCILVTSDKKLARDAIKENVEVINNNTLISLLTNL